MKKPEVASIDGLFQSGLRYKAPVFQRLYVWKETEIDTLMEDIETADPKVGQFLGAIVLKDLGKLHGPTSPTNYLMVDGQQRLTTFYLVLAALAKIAREHDDPDTSRYIAQNFLAESKSPKFEGLPRLVPTLQDRHAMWDILSNNIPKVEWDFTEDPGEQKLNPSDRIQPQWRRILEHFGTSLFDKKGNLLRDVFDRTLQSLQSQLKVIVITLEETDDANAIFSRLNASGIPLDLADLVRNEVFSKFRPDEGVKAEKFHTKLWQPFEKQFPPRSLNGFFPVYSYITFKGKVTKSAAFPNLQTKWSGLRPQAILSDLQEYAPYYISLSEFQNIDSLPAELNGLLERFSRMPRTTVTWPFVIEAFRAAAEKRLNAPTAVRVLKLVESFLVRRSLMGVEPTGLHAVFKTLWEKSKGNVDAVLGKVVTRTIQVPEDIEIRQSLANDPVDTRVILNYVFQEYERAFARKHKFDLAPTTITVEHIAPQHRSDGWKKLFSEEEHKRLVGVIGNLTPLSGSQNKSLQDQPWAEKRKRFKGSDFKTTQVLARRVNWTPKSVIDRTRDLTDWIITRWPPLNSI